MPVTVHRVRAEQLPEALGIGADRPRISWTVEADGAWGQRGYRLRISRDQGEPVEYAVDSPDQLLVDWPDRPLRSRERVTVEVRVVGDDGRESEWSAPLPVEAGLLDPLDWQAIPVGPDWWEDAESDQRRPALVRREFAIDGRITRARLYVTAHGLYEVELNGARVGAEALAPGWTVYPQRLRYHTYDVTDVLQSGPNAIGGWLGDGWYRGRLGWRGGFRNLFGSDLGLIAQLEVTTDDGRTVTISTDPSWKVARSPILHSGNYDGEAYDANLESPGWSQPGFDDSDWFWGKVGQRDPRTLVAPDGPPIRCTEEIRPVAVIRTPSGKQVLDFGQNFAGRIKFTAKGERGRTITLRTAEVMQEGELYTRPLRDARSTDSYVLAGRDSEEWEPRFTIHGFRYAEVDGWPGDLESAVENGKIIGRVYHSDMEPTGSFECSDPKLSQLHRNVTWGMRGNFVDVPTDCPQRDERAGWTGDIQVFAPTASFLYDCSGFLASWLTDVAIEQLPDGTVPWYVPVIPAHQMWTPIRPGAAWGDVAVLTPWVLYQRFGDQQVLENQYASAKAWVDLIDRLAGPDHLWNTGFQLGDWLDPDAPPQDPADAKTDKYLVASAYFAHSTATLAKIAATIGRPDDADHYRQLAEQARQAFCAEYVTTDDDQLRMTSDAQTAYALAISFELLPDDHSRRLAGARLAELVAEAGNRISTGFVGTPLVSDALSSTGHLDAAYSLLLEEECPSWLYAINQGATTVWERWDSLLPDGTVNPGTMTSFNHYALGAVADWMHRVVAGIEAIEPGYRRIRFRPRPGGGLTWAQASHRTPYGPASIRWERAEDGLQVVAEVPAGCTAVLDLSGQEPVELTPGQHRIEVPA